VVGEGARVAGGAGVASDVAPGASVAGYPAIEHRRWLRASVLFSRLAELAGQVAALRRELASLVAVGPHDRPACAAPAASSAAAAPHDRATCATPLGSSVAAPHDRPTCAAPLPRGTEHGE